GLADLFSTIQVNATKVMLGAPLPAAELPGARMEAWAKLQMLATQTDYSGGRLRVYLSNLQQGADEGVALRNAFEISAAELAVRASAYLRAGTFSAVGVSGETISPSRDFIEKQVPESAIAALISELKNAGRQFPPDSPRGLLAKGDRAALEQAVKANPRWA